jgi:hypothetical protein
VRKVLVECWDRDGAWDVVLCRVRLDNAGDATGLCVADCEGTDGCAWETGGGGGD